MKPAMFRCPIVALLWLTAVPALAQPRMQFATPLPSAEQPAAAAATTVYAPPVTAAASPPPTYAPGGMPAAAPAYPTTPGFTPAPTYTTPPAYAGSPAPLTLPAPPGATGYPAAPAYSAPPNATPGWTAPPAGAPANAWGAPQPGWATPNMAPGTVAPYGAYPAGSPAALSGTIQPPPAQWDPYGMPGTAQPTMLPQDPYYSYNGPTFSGTIGTMQRFLKQLRLDYVWMPGGNTPTTLGVNDIQTSATFALPFLYNAQSPLFITPGFGITLFQGPQGTSPTDLRNDMPPHEFDAYLDTAWNPQLTTWFSAELDARIGVYSDFKRVVDDSLRFEGKGMAVLGFSPSVKVKAGVWYINRTKIKLLPAGGIVWTPNPDVRFDVLFPDPKLAKRMSTINGTDWWVYFRGEYGGGTWTVDINPQPVLFDYNDIRTALGFEFFRPAGVHGLFEVGLSWERQIVFRGQSPITIDPTVFLRGGLTY